MVADEKIYASITSLKKAPPLQPRKILPVPPPTTSSSSNNNNSNSHGDDDIIYANVSGRKRDSKEPVDALAPPAAPTTAPPTDEIHYANPEAIRQYNQQKMMKAKSFDLSAQQQQQQQQQQLEVKAAGPVRAMSVDQGTAAAAAATAEGEEEDEEEPVFAKAKYAYEGKAESQLSFKAGEVIELLSFEENEAWWSGAIEDREGWFPASYVEMLQSAPGDDYEEDSDAEDDASAAAAPASVSQDFAARRAKRKHVVDEILSTEKV